ncbi:MAG: outer membrane protein transport protein [bacterium]|nr:outer membrane protein transport protein [bacterium]
MKRCLIGIVLVFAFLAKAGFGAGYEFGGLGSKAISMGGAFIGLADDWTAIYWNPAGLTQVSARGAGSYLSYAVLTGSDKNSVANNSEPFPQIYPTEPIKFTKEEIEVKAVLPSFGYCQKQEGFFFGGGLYTPNGNAIDWKDTMKDTTGADINASYHTLLFISIGNLSITKEITNNLSIGAGLNLLYGKLELEAKKNYSTTTTNFNYNLASKIEGDGTGFEGIVGILFRPSTKISIGGVVRSGKVLDLKGSGEVSLQGAMLGTSTGNEKSAYTQRFAYPATLGLGAAYRPTEKITLTADLARTCWNSMKEDIDFELDTGSGTTKFLKDRDKSLNWSNTDRFRLGFEYKKNDLWSLRAGFFTDPSPVPAEGVDITKLIDVNARFFTLGAGYKKASYEIDFAYVNSSGKETLNGVEYKEDGYAFNVACVYKF